MEPMRIRVLSAKVTNNTIHAVVTAEAKFVTIRITVKCSVVTTESTWQTAYDMALRHLDPA